MAIIILLVATVTICLLPGIIASHREVRSRAMFWWLSVALVFPGGLIWLVLPLFAFLLLLALIVWSALAETDDQYKALLQRAAALEQRDATLQTILLQLAQKHHQ
jgi:hypothetical protein